MKANLNVYSMLPWLTILLYKWLCKSNMACGSSENTFNVCYQLAVNHQA